MSGLGKKRTLLGKFIDNHKISQGELASGTDRNRDTISDLCDGSKSVRANADSQIAIIGYLRRKGHRVTIDDFWPM
jgi:putative transcriptional regulator